MGTSRHTRGIEGMLLTALLLAASPSAARNTAQADAVCTAWAAKPEVRNVTTFLYDHARDIGFLVVKGGCQVLDRDDEVRVRGEVAIRVINTNTALYTYGVTQQKVASPEIQDLKAFTKALSPYLVELGQGIFGSPVSAAPFPEGAPADLMTGQGAQVQRIQNLLYGKAASGGLYGILARVGTSLEEMREVEARQALLPKSRDPKEETDAIDRRLGNIVTSLKADIVNMSAFKEKEGDYRLETVGSLLTAFNSLSEAKDESPNEKAQKLLASRAEILDLAYEVEALGGVVLTAKTSQPMPRPVSVSASTGRSVTLKVVSSATRETSHVAGRGPKSFAFTVHADWLVRPALGLGFLVAPDAVYSTYGTTKDGDGVKVVASGTQDSRFTYGLTLGTTWRGLDGRAGNGFAVWAPELIVNPSSDLKAFGVGVGVSWSVVKLGVGGLWTKHTSLDGQSPGQALATADDLRLKEGYGSPKLFFSLCVFGWPPFVP